MSRMAAVPVMNPSLLNSRAGDTMALAKPVMGTRVPAPARLASLSNHPRPVSTAAAKTKVTDTAVPACSWSSPRFWYQFSRACPSAQMAPPTPKAQATSRHRGEGFTRAWTRRLYS